MCTQAQYCFCFYLILPVSSIALSALNWSSSKVGRISILLMRHSFTILPLIVSAEKSKQKLNLISNLYSSLAELNRLLSCSDIADYDFTAHCELFTVCSKRCDKPDRAHLICWLVDVVQYLVLSFVVLLSLADIFSSFHHEGWSSPRVVYIQMLPAYKCPLLYTDIHPLMHFNNSYEEPAE